MMTAIIGVAGVLLGTLVTGLLAHSREKSNRENALKLKELEIEAHKQEKQLDDRKAAYAELIQVTSTVNPEIYEIADLAQAHARVQMVCNSSLTTTIANDLYIAAEATRKRASEVKKRGKDPAKDDETNRLIAENREKHGAFIVAISTELYGVPFDRVYGTWVTDKEIGPAVAG